jgi:ribosomal protein S25
MDLEEFEKIEEETMQIIKRVGVVKPEWIAEQLKVKIEDAREVLEALRQRGDLAKDAFRGSYHKRKSRY